MGHPYVYERVLQDMTKYPLVTADGKFLAGWERYLRDEGFQIVYRAFSDLFGLRDFSGRVRGILGAVVPGLKATHIVAVDEQGVVDPADNAPDHIDIGEYIRNRQQDGFESDDVFLAVKKR